MGWLDKARCKDADPDIFFGTNDPYTAASAKKICKACPVIEECLQFALDTKEFNGVWGGTVPKERRAMMRGENIGRPKAETAH